MARELVNLGGSGAGGEAGVSGGLFLLCMIVFSLSIISMVIFACGDNNSGKPRHNHGAGGGGCGCGGGGCGGCGG
ncbi:Uncharacterized protein TCM_001723 [Theobroma cacao]|uniref:Uncharacterized protein n=1 Tax=Theobroma cacao TaxID=3641 RepID=A0A061DKB8_THECC|nr:Uncharacterized protein TCM_001723 [Theobroma cacao]